MATSAASATPATRAEQHRVPADPELRQRDGHAIGADAEEHGVREGDDAGIAQHDVVARGEHDEDADARRHAERARAGKEEGREGEAQQHRQQQQAQHRTTGPVAR